MARTKGFPYKFFYCNKKNAGEIMLLGTITCCDFQYINTLCALQQTLPNSKSSIWTWNATAGQWSFISARTWLRLAPLTLYVQPGCEKHRATVSSGSREEMNVFDRIKYQSKLFDLMYRHTNDAIRQWQCGVTLSRTVFYTLHLFAFLQPLGETGLMGFLKKHCNLRNAEL